jgi:hypothetical protein
VIVVNPEVFGEAGERRCVVLVKPRDDRGMVHEELERLIVESCEAVGKQRRRRVRHDRGEQIGRRHRTVKHRLAPGGRRQRNRYDTT